MRVLCDGRRGRSAMMVINKALPTALILCLILMESGNSVAEERSGRSKRFVVFPFGGTFKVTVNYKQDEHRVNLCCS